MRILMVTPMPPQKQATGAIPLVLHAQLTALRERHRVTLVTLAGPDPADRSAVDALRGSGLDVHAVWRDHPHGRARWQRRRRQVSTWLRGQCPWRTVYFWEPRLQQTLDVLLHHERFDLVTAEDNAMAAYTFRTDRPVLLTEHEVRRPRRWRWQRRSDAFGARWQLARTFLAEVDWRRWRGYQQAVWQRFDRIQVFSARDAAVIRELAPDLAERVRVNPFAVDLPPPADHRLQEPGRLLFTGNFTHPPNLDAVQTLVGEILPQIRAGVPGVHLDIVGIDPPPSVWALAAPDVTVHGYVPDLTPLIARAAVVVAPIRTGGGMRMKVLHSMATGKAVVTTPRGAEGLLAVGVTPPVVIADTSGAFAEAVISLLRDAPTRDRLGQQAREFVTAHFSPEAFARRLEAIYAELTPESTPSGGPVQMQADAGHAGGEHCPQSHASWPSSEARS